MRSAVEQAPLSPVMKAALALEVLEAYLRVRRALGRQDLPRLVAAVRATPRSGRAFALGVVGADEARLSRAVVRTTAALPSGTRCLTRSLVLLTLLSRRGTPAELVIAVQPMGQSTIDAHAWVEVDGRPLLAPAPDYGRLVTL